MSLATFVTFLNVLILSHPLSGTLPLGGRSYTTAQQRNIPVNSMAPDVPLWLSP